MSNKLINITIAALLNVVISVGSIYLTTRTILPIAAMISAILLGRLIIYPD